MNAVQEVNERRALTQKDVSEIYGVGKHAGYRIIREVRAKYPNGHPLPVGKIFKSDLADFFEKRSAVMEVRKCPARKYCFDYKESNCEVCDFGNEYTKLHKRIDRLKKQNETLTIQRNAWALTVKDLANEWISVEDRLPELVGSYLVFTNDRRMYICRFIDYYCDGDAQFDDYKVTHWMPLPEPPKVATDNNVGNDEE